MQRNWILAALMFLATVLCNASAAQQDPPNPLTSKPAPPSLHFLPQ